MTTDKSLSCAYFLTSKHIKMIFVLGLSACASTQKGSTVVAGGTTLSEIKQEKLHVTQDECGIERDLAKALEKRGYELQYEEKNHDGRILIPFRSDQTQFQVVVDTRPSSTDNKERAVLLILRTGYYVSGEVQKSVLRVVNDHHNRAWFGTFLIDTEDDELLGSWAMNLPNTELETTFVDDAIQRLSQSWIGLHDRLGSVALSQGEHQNDLKSLEEQQLSQRAPRTTL